MNVEARVEAIGTFRFIEVYLMETVARWVPLTPEMEVKVMFGRHIWEFAQHADWLGKRTFELRRPEHYTKPAAADYLSILEATRAAATTPAKLSMLYDVIIPGTIRRYESYLSATDALLDAPSVVIMERIASNLKRQCDDAGRLRLQLGISAGVDASFQQRETSIANVVAGAAR
jgi:hypothetical protein